MKSIKKYKFLNSLNPTYFSSIKAKSGTIGQEIASSVRKWSWMLFSVKFKARYEGLKLGGHLIVAIL